MPQLDALTYFSQYIYLLITFSAVYYYVLYFIIPKIVSALKIRQKLNSLNLNQIFNEKQKKQAAFVSDSAQLLDILSKHCPTFSKKKSKGSEVLLNQPLNTSNATTQYNHLINQAWLAVTSQASAVEFWNKWLISTVALQLAHNLRFKKLLCDHIVRKITPN